MANYNLENPFGTIESAQEYMRLLADAVLEAKQDLESDIDTGTTSRSSRQLEALRVALFTLNKLDHNVQKVLRGLNDLRSLHRLMWREREQGPPSELGGDLVPALDGEPLKKVS
jgi:hypothetical protein